MVYELFIDGLLFFSGTFGCPAHVGDNTQQGLRAGRPTRANFKNCFAFLVAFLAQKQVINAQGFSMRYVDTRPAMQYSSVFIQDTLYYTIGISTQNVVPFHAKPMWSNLSNAGDLNNYQIFNEFDNHDYGTFYNTSEIVKDSLVKIYGYTSDTANLFPSLFTIKLDGTVLKYTVFSDSGSDLVHGDYMCIDTNDNCYLTASYQYLPGAIDAYIVKINSQDSILWKKRYGALGPWDEAVTSVSVMRNNHVIVGSYKNDQNLPNMKSYTWLFEIDSNGLIVRQWFDSDSTMEAKGLKQTSDGGFIYVSNKILSQDLGNVYCHSTVVKLDTAFAKQWIWEGDLLMGYPSGTTDVEELPDGNFVVCGNGNYINPDYNLLSGFVLKLRSDGSVIWKHGYTAMDTTGVQNFLNDIDALPDGSYVAVGFTNLPSSVQTTQRQQAWMLKIDSSGCVIENCLVAIESPKGDLKGQIQIQPNPASDRLWVEVESGMLGGELKIYDVSGRLVKQLMAEALQFGVAVSDLSKGVYVISIEHEGVLGRGKLVKE